MINIPITAITAAICALILFMQTYSVILRRIKDNIVLGDNEDRTILKRIRGHGNMIEQAPIFLILLLIAEAYVTAPSIFLAAIASLFVIGRMSHGLYFLDIGLHWKWRRYGMMATMLTQLMLLLTVLIGTLFF